ncbi:Rieske (2Fe-2S) protein [Oleiphilus messinensis]|uniref:Rieske (2Fe-2S) protein n=1 Tax=Oleiphilus messinensis TaxID=141451 RepID=A0A1Y0I1L8_9GAMM|nr:SRPBCC family protein [Oleiphilus messinensis]ARU54301.1 Rieske (2Fe-2S) protein [Oleiphilus messinensis]
MDRQTEIRLIKDVLALKAKGETQYHASTQTHSTERYVSDVWFKQELDNIFLGRPMAIGVASEVPNVGDYIALDWIKGMSLLMVRDQHNHIRVFANACRHRNARLVEHGKGGCKKKFSCPYHAWTYSTEGELVGAPDFERGFSDLDKKALGLIEFNSRVVQGIVFVHLDLDQQLPETLLADEMKSGFDFLDIEKQRVYKRRSYVLKANWKILTEGGIEAYHFNVAHRNTLAPFFLGNLSTWETWGGMDMRMILPKKTMLEASSLPEDKWDMRKMANIIYTLSPSLLFLAQPDNISLIRMVPLSPGETRIEEVLLVDAPKNGSNAWSEEELKRHETNHNLVYKILSEDWLLGEAIQANMESGVVKEVHFGRFESALTWFHTEYEKALGLDNRMIARAV